MSVKELLLNPRPLPTEVVALPELGEGVAITVRGLTARQRNELELSFIKRDGRPDPAKQRQMRELWLVACCVDDAGNKLFTAEDVIALGNQDAAIIDRIFEASQRVCGGRVSVEDAAKN
jgi:hypothetical protein